MISAISAATGCLPSGGHDAPLDGSAGIVIGRDETIEAYAAGYPIRVSTFGQASSPLGHRVVVGFTHPA